MNRLPNMSHIIAGQAISKQLSDHFVSPIVICSLGELDQIGATGERRGRFSREALDKLDLAVG
jgi:hypothetical protein